MSQRIKIYKINDFIRKDQSGEMDLNKSIQTVRELSSAASLYPGHNILVDLRETTVTIEGVETILKVVDAFVQLMPFFKNKIANLVPDDLNREPIASMFETYMTLQNYQYRFFMNFEDAIGWLSEIET